MLDDDGANAFAKGRRTICITREMLNAPVKEIKAVLGHEFGHLAHKI
ncbi:MAG: M48 family metalloprotease [Beduini sp.]